MPTKKFLFAFILSFLIIFILTNTSICQNEEILQFQYNNIDYQLNITSIFTEQDLVLEDYPYYVISERK